LSENLNLELANKLILDGKPAAAYSLLEPFEFEQAGNTQFDYLLGLSALNNNQPDKASLIFERILAVDPLFAAAKVDLGRAYFQMGDVTRARSELSSALALHPPLAAQATINLYLRKIEASGNKSDNRLSGYIEIGTGNNDNINSSTNQSQIVVPVLLDTQITLNQANVKTADNYVGLIAGGEALHQVNSHWSLYADMELNSRNNLKHSNFNLVSLDAQLGANFKKNAELIKAGWVVGQLNLGGAVNRKSDGFNAEWKHFYNEANQTHLFGQYSRYRYPATLLVTNNFNQTITGMGWTHNLADGNSTITGSIFAGNEQDTNLRVDGGKKIEGMRLSAQSSVGGRLNLYASAGFQKEIYDRNNSTFLVFRHDQQSNLSGGLTYRYTPEWILHPQLSLIKNKSNIVIDRYDQFDFSFNLRREIN
jgi:hypothetical protein